MTRIIADISISLDGYVTGPDPGLDNGLGTGGEGLHTWAFSDDPEDRRIVRETTERSGAVVLGRRLFDIVDGPKGWNDESGYGAGEVGKPAFVVVTSEPPRPYARPTSTGRSSPPVCTTPSPPHANAREAASARSGEDLDVYIMGGGVTHDQLGPRRRPGRRAEPAPRARRAGRGHPLFSGGVPAHSRSAA